MTAGSCKISLPPYIKDICAKIQEAGFKSYVVGGALRDQLLGDARNPMDLEWDVATSARPGDVRKIFRKTVPTGIAHGTVMVVVDDRTCEVTTFRQEGDYSDARHPDRVTFLESIEEDLARRDFTVNAMAFDPIMGHFVDPYGGEEDLKHRILRAVGKPTARFREDGLRPLRGARFVAVLGFRMEQETFEAMEKTVKSFLRVSAERKRDEIVKMTEAKRPSLGWEVLRKANYIKAIFPEMSRMIGTAQGGLHRYDVWNHSILACDFCAGAAWQVKLAALLHDCGKPGVGLKKEDGKAAEPEENGRVTFYGHEEAGEAIVEQWMERMRFSGDDTTRVTRLVRHHMINYSPEWTDAAVRRFIKRTGADLLDDLVRLAEADIKARGTIGESLSLLNELKSRIHEQLERDVALAVKDLSIDGRDIMKKLDLDPGPRVGEILQSLLDSVIENPSLNRREKLLEMVRAMGDGTDSRNG
ncbi:MAG: HD domain-containing protein [Pseudomonadota bacterium]